MNEIHKPVIVGFPLRGEWHAPNTPGKKIPSHGTEQWGTRYAYDFLQVDWKRRGRPGYTIPFGEYLFFGVPLNKCYCWGKEVHAPCDGIIIQASDDYKERKRAHLFTDLFAALKNAYVFNPVKDDIASAAGNYVIIKCGEGVYAGLVHLQTGSIAVSAGHHVKKGDVIGRIGHSGNSFFPHLHFQLMDSSDILTAKGLPCAFEEYEVLRNGKWEKIFHGIPDDKDRIRF